MSANIMTTYIFHWKKEPTFATTFNEMAARELVARLRLADARVVVTERQQACIWTPRGYLRIEAHR